MRERPKDLADIVGESDFTKSQSYNLDKSRFGFIENAIKQAEALLMIHYDVLPLLWDFSGRLLFEYLGYGPEYEVMFILFYLHKDINTYTIKQTFD